MSRYLVLVMLSMVCAAAAAQNRSFSTNFADCANYGTINFEGSYGMSRHWSVNAGVKYNPFTFGEGESAVLSRQRLLSAGARYWPWHIFSGWWLGGKIQYQEFARGGFGTPETREGDRYGASAYGGYSKMLGRHFNLDLGFGFWTGYSTWTTYACQRCGAIKEKGRGVFLLPNDLIIALAYVF